MKLKIKADELLKALVKVVKIVPKSGTIPVLSNVLFMVDNNKLRLRGTDLSMVVEVVVEGVDFMDELDGTAFTVNGKILFDVVKEIGKGIDLVLDYNEEKKEIKIKTGNGEYKLGTIEVREFPDVSHFFDRMKDDDIIRLEAGEMLTEAIKKTIFATSDEELQGAIMGVYCEQLNGSLILTATDGHRLSSFEIKNVATNNIEEKDIIIPKKALMLVLDNFSKGGAEFYFAGNNFKIVLPESRMVIAGTGIDGKYPKYRNVIPTDNEKLVEFDKGELLASLQRVGLFADVFTKGVLFEISEKQIELTANSQEKGDGKETIAADWRGGEPLQIKVNEGYLKILIMLFWG